MRIVGIDFGTKVSGISFSDEGRIIAVSKESISGYKNMQELSRMILEKIEDRSVKEIVIGNPVHMNGRQSNFFDEIKNIGRFLEENTGIKVIYWDERLSTIAVERSMIEGDLSRKKRKKAINAGAAQWILQGYLDFLNEKEKKDRI